MVNSISREGIDFRGAHMIDHALELLMGVYPNYTRDIDEGKGDEVAKSFRTRAEKLRKND